MGKKGSGFFKWLAGKENDDSEGNDGKTASMLPELHLKETIRKENEELRGEHDMADREYVKLKQVVNQLDREYEESKNLDPVRRYEVLKEMVKRATTHHKLQADRGKPTWSQSGKLSGAAGGTSGLLQSCRAYAHQMEGMKDKEMKYDAMSKKDLLTQNQKLRSEIDAYRSKCARIRSLIDQLGQKYQESKGRAFTQRYGVLKTMIKDLTKDSNI